MKKIKMIKKLRLRGQTIRTLDNLAIARGGLQSGAVCTTDNTMKSDCCSAFDLCVVGAA